MPERSRRWGSGGWGEDNVGWKVQVKGKGREVWGSWLEGAGVEREGRRGMDGLAMPGCGMRAPVCQVPPLPAWHSWHSSHGIDFQPQHLHSEGICVWPRDFTCNWCDNDCSTLLPTGWIVSVNGDCPCINRCYNDYSTPISFQMSIG